MRPLFTLILMMVLSAPSLAGWQFTQWGMTPTEFENAAKAAGLPLMRQTNSSDTTKELKFIAPYQTDKFNFDASFTFADGDKPRLNNVLLKLTDLSQCAELISALETLYGKPAKAFTAKGIVLKEWHDKKLSNIVTILAGEGKACSIAYTDLQEKTKGL